MEYERFKNTTVGSSYFEYLEKGYFPSIDLYLDYIIGLEKMKTEDSIWNDKIDAEIEATKRIIKKLV